VHVGNTSVELADRCTTNISLSRSDGAFGILTSREWSMGQGLRNSNHWSSQQGDESELLRLVNQGSIAVLSQEEAYSAESHGERMEPRGCQCRGCFKKNSDRSEGQYI